MPSPRVWNGFLDRMERGFRNKLVRIKNANIRAAAESYEATGSVPAHLKEQHVRRLNTALTEQYMRVIPPIATMTRRELGKKATFLNLMTEWVTREALRKAKIIAATDSDDISDAIAEGIAEGLGTAEIARNIRKVSELTLNRSNVIARTETHAAATYGSIQTVRDAEQELGVRMLKQWLPTGDDRTRDDHAAMANHPPIPLDEKFIVGGELMDRPGDPSASPGNVISCRCTMLFTEAN